ncbi:Tetratricopeptide repeat protein [compost metagenome]
MVSIGNDYYNLGDHSRRVSTSSERAQIWFDRGLIWSYAFNFEEGVRCFERAAYHDPSCAMAYWGIAYAMGPNYNKSWRLFDPDDFSRTTRVANEALKTANRLGDRATAVEQALIEALPVRFSTGKFLPPPERQDLNVAYAEAMRRAYQAHPDDLDVAGLFADALLCVSPRQLWDLSTGAPVGYGTVEARNLLERALNQTGGAAHPALNHLYIHLMEMSPFPELALPAADRVRRLAPDAGHMAHMTSHIDNAVGNYRSCIDSNLDAASANDRYLDRVEGAQFYHIYRVHDLYVLIFGAMMLGRFQVARDAAARLVKALPDHLLSVSSPPMADWAESHYSAFAHVLIRFGRWEEIIALELPEDRELFCVTVAMILYAKGVAFSALGRLEEAEQARAAFADAVAVVPETRMSLPNREIDVLKVAAAMLDGEFEYRKGNFDLAYSKLREAIELEDALKYADPRSWLQPVRHAYGALLLEQGHIEEAEAVYRSDLGLDGKLPRPRIHPNNVWSLHGLHECLVRLGRQKEAELIKLQRDIAVASADVQIGASCFCRMSRHDSAEQDRESMPSEKPNCCA